MPPIPLGSLPPILSAEAALVTGVAPLGTAACLELGVTTALERPQRPQQCLRVARLFPTRANGPSIPQRQFWLLDPQQGFF